MDNWSKQTQFKPIKPNLRKAKMNVNLYVIKEYENETAFKLQKNKPNSNPICRPSSVLEFTQEFIPGSHPPDSQQGSAGFSVSLPGVFCLLSSVLCFLFCLLSSVFCPLSSVLCFLMQPKLLNFHRKNSLTVGTNSVKYLFLCNERECFYEKLYGKRKAGRA